MVGAGRRAAQRATHRGRDAVRANAGEPAIAAPLAPALLALLSARLRETASGDAVLARQRLRERLTVAGALRPVFQPIVSLSSGRRFGHLALTRFADVADEHTAPRFAEARKHETMDQATVVQGLSDLDVLAASEYQQPLTNVADPLQSYRRVGAWPAFT